MRRTDGRTDGRWLPPRLRRELVAIAKREGLTLDELLVAVAREFARSYREVIAAERSCEAAPRGDRDNYETVWPRGRDDSLIGWRPSKPH